MIRQFKKSVAYLSLFAAIIFISCNSKAGQTDFKPEYITIAASEGTPLKASPEAENSDNTALYGEIFQTTEAPKGGFVKARNIATGAEGYLDTLRINNATYPLLAPELAENEIDEPFLLNIETLSGGETTTGWAFWKDGNGVKAMKLVRLVYNDGRSTSVQTYYKGVAKDGYLLLTEEIAYGEDSGEKLETPIIIWEDIAGRAGIFAEGLCFTPGGQVGGFDTDGWD